jgi:predicted phage terminase large subunit-like protein
MGQPRPRGATVFAAAPTFGAQPQHYRIAIGLDLAYTAKKSSDWCVAVVLAEWAGHFYVLEVLRAQATAPDFGASLVELARRYPGVPMYWRSSGTERGVADLLRGDPWQLPIVDEAIKGDKFVLAQPVAAAWNRGEIRLPPDPRPWIEPLVQELRRFTGQGDTYDDQVDALGTAFDALPTLDMTLHSVPSRYA